MKKKLEHHTNFIKFIDSNVDLMRTVCNVPKPTNLTKTTFRMTKSGYDALNKLAERKGASVGNILDVLSLSFSKEEFLEEVVAHCGGGLAEGERVRRSYAVDKHTLTVFNRVQNSEVVTRHKVSRDELLETTAKIYLSVIEHSDQELKVKLKLAQEACDKAWRHFGDLCEEIKELLSDYPDHPIFDGLSLVDLHISNFDTALSEEIASGTPMDTSGI